MDGPMRGPEVVLTYWRLFSLSFDDICVETERLDKRVESNTLVVTTATSVTISKDTLRLVFPHLDSNKKGLFISVCDQSEGVNTSHMRDKGQGH
ncbi:hypothetical protein PC129_g4636 [Phytophthora cactorum]|uniref:Uncharacterized protein n=1 Tax=Phytophthora cactorum TaxID=29920 RepID=A0A8T1IP47_9STRA|nr:hypothetical protein PC129_g4636 [Phytophthora cactorum]